MSPVIGIWVQSIDCTHIPIIHTHNGDGTFQNVSSLKNSNRNTEYNKKNKMKKSVTKLVRDTNLVSRIVPKNPGRNVTLGKKKETWREKRFFLDRLLQKA
jgi:hypothetical protein